MSAPVVVFPDATSIAVQAITAGLDDLFSVDAPVRDRAPDPRPDAFVLVRRDGGPRMWPTWDRPQLSVQSWGKADEEAHDLAQQVRTALNAAAASVVDGVTISRVEEASGLSLSPDPLSDQPRYVQTFILTLRGEAP